MAASTRNPYEGRGADVTHCHLTVANSHVGTSNVASLPPLSGAEVCLALTRHGLKARLDGPDWMWLERDDGARVVRVPLVARLRPGLLRVILAAVELAPDRFAAYLASE
jgi:hypothetical protein